MFKANTVDSSTTGMVKKEHASTQSESMIFKDYNTIEDKMFRIIDNDGQVIKSICHSWIMTQSGMPTKLCSMPAPPIRWQYRFSDKAECLLTHPLLVMKLSK